MGHQHAQRGWSKRSGICQIAAHRCRGPGLVGQLTESILLLEPGIGHFNSRVADLDLITILAHTARDGELGDLDAAGIAELDQNSVIVGVDHKTDECSVAGCHVYLSQYGRVSDPRDYELQK